MDRFHARVYAKVNDTVEAREVHFTMGDAYTLEDIKAKALAETPYKEMIRFELLDVEIEDCRSKR